MDWLLVVIFKFGLRIAIILKLWAAADNVTVFCSTAIANMWDHLVAMSFANDWFNSGDGEGVDWSLELDLIKWVRFEP